MSKFAKKIKKYIGENKNVLVVGRAFGHLESLKDIFNTVFVVNNFEDRLKYKNFVYRENFDSIVDIGNVAVILVDIEQIKSLESMPTYWTKYKPIVLIEGNDPIDRTKSSYLYKYGYRCVEQLGFCHVWKRYENSSSNNF